jgi:Leucine-rich repeat (LRR) protein
LAGLTGLEDLYLDANQFRDITPLAGLTGLEDLYLDANQISYILPLVNNYGIDSGDEVSLQGNPLGTTACTDHIPALESRGVYVHHDCP